MYSVLAIGVLYMVGMYYNTRSKTIKSTEEHTTYHEEGGVQARGDVPTVAISPAREMVGEDTGTPYATHPDDVLKVHKALQDAHMQAQLKDHDLRAVVRSAIH